MKKPLIIGTLIATLAVSGVALARPGGHGGGPGMFMIGRILHDLNLTDAQEDAAVQMHKDIQKRGKELRVNGVESMDEVAVELAKPKPDAARLHAIADQRIDDVKKLVHYSIDRFLSFHQTLTPDQRNQIGKGLEKAQRHAKMWSED
ncbi:MAG: periplasmic heavy metal sensor [Myxococcota bacterium]